MFSAVTFHDYARKRGVKPILGCEVYVAPGDRRDQERHAGRDGQPPGAAGGDQRGLPQPDQAGVVRLHGGLLLQAAHRQGPARAAQQGPDRSHQLPQGRGRREASTRIEQREGARRGGDLSRHPRPRQFLPRDAVPGHRRAADRQHAACRRIARDLGLPLVCTNDVHYLREDDYKPHDILLCIGTGKSVNDADRLRYHGDQFFLKTPEEMAEDLRRVSRRARQHGAHRRARRRQPGGGDEPPAELRRPGGLHPRRLLRAHGARGLRGAAAAAAGARWRAARCGTRSTSTSGASSTKSP